MAQEAWRAYLELALGMTEASTKKAAKAVKRLVGKGGATAEQLQLLAEDLVKAGSANREAITKLVRYELDRSLGKVGLATAEEVSALTGRIHELESQLRVAESSGSVGPVGGQAKPSTAVVVAAEQDETPGPVGAEIAAGATSTGANKAVKKAVAKKVAKTAAAPVASPPPVAAASSVGTGAAEPAATAPVASAPAATKSAKPTKVAGVRKAVGATKAGPTKVAGTKATATKATVTKATSARVTKQASPSSVAKPRKATKAATSASAAKAAPAATQPKAASAARSTRAGATVPVTQSVRGAGAAKSSAGAAKSSAGAAKPSASARRTEKVGTSVNATGAGNVVQPVGKSDRARGGATRSAATRTPSPRTGQSRER